MSNIEAKLSGRHHLDDGATVWRVAQGEVHVFLARSADSGVGSRHHLWTARAGDLLFGCPPIDGHLLVATETLGTRVTMTPLEAWPPQEEPARKVELLAFEKWLAGLLHGVAKLVTPRPAVSDEISPAAAKQILKNTVLGGSAPLTWVAGLGNASLFMGTENVEPGSVVPLTPDSWAITMESVEARGLDVDTLFREGSVQQLLQDTHGLILRTAITNARLADVDSYDRLQYRASASSRRRTEALKQLLAVLQGRPTQTTESAADPLASACRVLGEELGVRFEPAAPEASSPESLEARVEILARASGLRWRVISLPPAWWTMDLGPLLVLRESDGTPLAAIRRRNHYRSCAAAGSADMRIDAANAADIGTKAIMFYRPFPEGLNSALGLFRFAMQGTGRDLATLSLTLLGLGLAACATPLAFGLFAGWLLPTGNLAALWGLLGGLVAFGIVSACLQAVQGLSWLRIEGRGEGAATAALVDRLLRLPVSFFHEYGSGDLGNRVLSISALRTIVTTVTLGSLAPALIGLVSIVLLVLVDGTFALASVAVATAVLVAAAWIARHATHAQSKADEMTRNNANLLLDVVTGIQKLRVTATEDLFLSRWAQTFSAQRLNQAKVDRLDDHFRALGVALPLLVLAAACYLGTLLPLSPSGEGRLIAAQIALLQVALASHALGNAWIKLRRTKPLREKLEPLLQVPVESRPRAEEPGVLTGEIRLTHVNFSYGTSANPVLQDLSLHIKAGEFVALVGPSGCGKSTILRLLLGFERPASGTVEWDGRDMERLNLEPLRRQVGTVLQTGTILPGNIRQFIAGPNQLSDDEIWEALRLARVDADIRRLPMGLHTGLGNNGGGFSGGQRQRLLLAKSLVTRPRVLILDEATSALDNKAQAEVMATLRQLDCTRIVVAHRLSTIRNADRIITMVAGKIVQSGTYEELVSIPGPFQDLVRRQQLD